MGRVTIPIGGVISNVGPVANCGDMINLFRIKMSEWDKKSSHWTDDQIRDNYLNIALRETAIFLPIEITINLIKKTELELAGGKVSLPDDYIAMSGKTAINTSDDTHKPVEIIRVDEVTDTLLSEWTAPGDDINYCYISGGEIHALPNSIAKLTITYLSETTDMVDNNDITGFPAIINELIVYDACRSAMEDMNDVEKSRVVWNLWKEKVGFIAKRFGVQIDTETRGG